MDAVVEPFKARRVYLLLSDRIATSELRPGERLPAEPVLASEYGVSRVTIRRALARLAADGVLERRAGVGNFVRQPATTPVSAVDISDVFANLREMGRSTDVRLLSFGYVPAPPTVAEQLGLKATNLAQRSVRVRSVNAAPFSYLTAHVPEAIGRTYSQADLARVPLLTLLERSGLVLAGARQTIGVTIAGPEVARALDLEIGAPLLSLSRVVFDLDGRGIEHLHGLYRPDRFTFKIDLLRTGAPDARRWKPSPAALDPIPA